MMKNISNTDRQTYKHTHTNEDDRENEWENGKLSEKPLKSRCGPWTQHNIIQTLYTHKNERSSVEWAPIKVIIKVIRCSRIDHKLCDTFEKCHHKYEIMASHLKLIEAINWEIDKSGKTQWKDSMRYSQPYLVGRECERARI